LKSSKNFDDTHFSTDFRTQTDSEIVAQEAKERLHPGEPRDQSICWPRSEFQLHSQLTVAV
jgi:hypothetical protein